MNKETKFEIYETALVYGKRCLVYTPQCYMYWYNGRLVKECDYSYNRWRKVISKHNKNQYCHIERNDNFSWDINRNFDELIARAVKEDKEQQ